MAGGHYPTALRERLGDAATFGLKELLDGERDEWSERVMITAADRFERRLAVELGVLRNELRDELHNGLTSVRQEVATTRVEILRWSFLFWIGQLATIACLLAFMLGGTKP